MVRVDQHAFIFRISGVHSSLESGVMLKVTRFQLLNPKRFSAVVINIFLFFFGVGGGGVMSNRVNVVNKRLTYIGS